MFAESREITCLKGVGPKLADKLAKLGIVTVQDILFHLPFRYQNRTKLTVIQNLRVDQEVLIEGDVISSQVIYGRRRSLVCRLKDQTGTISLRFFHFSAAQQHSLVEGVRLRCFGVAKFGQQGIELYHPEYTKITSSVSDELPDALTPVYPATEGISQTLLRKLLKQTLNLLQDGSLPELMPSVESADITPDITPDIATTSLENALRFIHNPPADAPVQLLMEGKHPCQHRLVFEELLAHHLSLLRFRQLAQSQHAPCLDGAEDPELMMSLHEKLMAAFGFTLTSAQQKVWQEILADLNHSFPMMRLLQGDVGSGKTAVAALAALQAIASGYQVALMAPTEILAEQHANAFSQWFSPLGISSALFTGRIKGKRRTELLADVENGVIRLLIGTHALFQNDVSYKNLGLIIIDEQHRFGVHQRLALREKALPERAGEKDTFPHQLIMTATPIPRTLAMSAYADLDISILDELPPGRTPVNTAVVDNNRRAEVIDRVRLGCSQGRQAYWVCTLIEESETLQCQAAEAITLELKELLPDLEVGLVHGRLKADDKAAVMDSFEQGATDLLVATTVVEVGVNVPNASLMIIENPERLGLAQLHQLRGRVGRGAVASHCVLLYKAPLSMQSKQRLQVLRDTNDGFIIAEEDLKLRGPGDVLGTRQTGLMEFKIANLQRDADLLPAVKEMAHSMINVRAAVIEPLVKRWISNREAYANA